MSIRKATITASKHGAQYYTEPPSHELNLTVIRGNAYLSVSELDEKGNHVSSEEEVIVPAQSLLHILRAAIDDDNS